MSEEYFEFLDIFESAIDAEGSYTMLEWGAGFGRWTGLGLAAAREMGISQFSLGCVEAFPEHIRYINDNFNLLGVSGDQAVIYPFALAGKAGKDTFLVGTPLTWDTDDRWYGQTLDISHHYDLKPNGKFYEGVPLLEDERGWQGIEVTVVTASSILINYGFIDIIDMDLQGAEADVIDESIAQLTNQVRRLHIGTHGPDIEDRIRATLSAHGWIKLRDLPVAATSQTPFGEVTCVDGVQSWFNPRFPPPGWKA